MSFSFNFCLTFWKPSPPPNIQTSPKAPPTFQPASKTCPHFTVHFKEIAIPTFRFSLMPLHLNYLSLCPSHFLVYTIISLLFFCINTANINNMDEFLYGIDWTSGYMFDSFQNCVLIMQLEVWRYQSGNQTDAANRRRIGNTMVKQNND